MMNYITSYRSLSTGEYEVKIKDNEGTKTIIGFMQKAAKKVLSYITDFTKNIPIIGGIISVIDKAVEDIYDTHKQSYF